MQLVAIACFLAWPMRFSFERPVADGALGALFAALASFDQPFNQAPALHIALLVIVWTRFAAVFGGRSGFVAYAWFALIGISVVTTYQHHFIDIPTGALLGFLALWVWPDDGSSPLARLRLADDPIRRSLAWAIRGGGRRDRRNRRPRRRWRCPMAAVARDLSRAGRARLCLDRAIRLPEARSPAFDCVGLAVRPVHGRRLDQRPAVDAPATGRSPHLRRCLDRAHAYRREWRRRSFAAMVDLCAELPAPAGVRRHHALAWLDLAAPSPDALRAAAATIEAARREGDVLVCCALGYGRSASAVAAWLVATCRASTVDEALDLVRKRRPAIVVRREHVLALAAACEGTARYAEPR